METLGIVRLMLPVHVLAGAIGLLSGYVALSVAKGGTVHRKSGMLFVCVMLTVAVTGLLISALEGVAPEINIPTAALTFYLVITSLTTVRPPAARSRKLDIAAMVLGLAIGLTCLALAFAALASGGARFGMAFPLLMFGVVALLASAGDLRVIRQRRRSRRASTRAPSVADVLRAVHFVDCLLSRPGQSSRGVPHPCPSRGRSAGADLCDVVLAVAHPRQAKLRCIVCVSTA